LQGKESRMGKKDLKKSPEVIFNLLVPAASLERNGFLRNDNGERQK